MPVIFLDQMRKLSIPKYSSTSHLFSVIAYTFPLQSISLESELNSLNYSLALSQAMKGVSVESEQKKEVRRKERRQEFQDEGQLLRDLSEDFGGVKIRSRCG